MTKIWTAEMLKQLVVILAFLIIGGDHGVLAQQQELEEEKLISKQLYFQEYYSNYDMK